MTTAPKDQSGNASARLVKAPEFSAADYYDQSRARTYACCFSLENPNFIWSNYGNGNGRGKAGIGFNFGRLRAMINRTLQPGNAVIEYRGERCRQVFSVNYGLIDYVEWGAYQGNAKRLPNPIEYTYLKDKKYSEEKELRISLSALGIGQFALKDGSMMQFPPYLHLAFDFKAAIANQVIEEIPYDQDCDSEFLLAELQKLCIVPRKNETNFQGP